jgi:steroid delta-isomerase-like uncharacterized protein
LKATSRLFAGRIFLPVITLLLFYPLSINAQGPASNTTNSWVSSEQEENNNNKAIILAFTEAFNDRNYTAIEQYVAENITEHRPGVQSGRNSTIAFLQSLANAFPDFQTSIDHMVAEGDRVVVFTTTNGTHQGEFIFAPGVPPTGKQVSFKTADMYRISNGQLVEHWDVIEILDTLAAMGAITFSQPPPPPPPPSINSTNNSGNRMPQQ